MTTIYLVRHGESVGNSIRSFLGHTDLPLTEKGHLQAEMTASYLKNVGADVIYSSDLLRAYQTAIHTAEALGMTIVKNDKLREIFAGEWENVLFDELCVRYPESYLGVWKNDIGNSRCDGGESVAELRERIVSEVTRIAEENDGKTVFIFTHATPIRVFASHCRGMSLGQIKDIPWASNASVTKAEFDGEFRLLFYGEDSFMGKMSTSLPKNV